MTANASKDQRDEKYGRPSERAVMNGVLMYVSPSQLKSFDPELGGCERAWFFDKVQHYQRREIKGQQTGKDGHAQIENLLLTGQNSLSSIALAGIQHLPTPKSNLLVEHPVHYIPKPGQTVDLRLAQEPKLVIAGLPMIGYIDLVDLNTPGHVAVTDYKFLSSIARYAKTPTEARKDVQTISYLKWASLRWPKATLSFRFLYFQTKGAKHSEPVCAELTREEIEPHWVRFASVVERMKLTPRKAPTEVPPNIEACGAYGGCSFQAVCPDSPVRRRFQVSLLSRINAQTNGGSTTSTNTTPKTEERKDGAGVPAKNATVGKNYIVKAGTAVGVNVDTVLRFAGPASRFGLFNDIENLVIKVEGLVEVFPTDAAVGAALGGEKLPEGMKSKPEEKKPEEKKPEEKKPEEKKSEEKKSEEKKSEEKKPEVIASTTTPAGTKVNLVTEGVVPPDVALAPPVEEKKPDQAAAPLEEKKERKPRTKKIESSSAAPTESAGTKPPPPVATEGALTLFIDCVPDKPYLDLSNYVWKVAQDVAKAATLEDVRISDGGPLGFNKWTGFLAQQALANPPAGPCVIWSNDLSRPVAEALATIAVLVVRGKH